MMISRTVPGCPVERCDLRGANRLEQIVGGWGIGRMESRFGIADDPLVVNHEGSRQLPGAPDRAPKPRHAKQRADYPDGGCGVEEGTRATLDQPVSGKGIPVWVGKHGKGQSQLPPERGRLCRCPLSNDCQRCPFPTHPIVIAAQLRRLLAAKHSAKMTQEDQDQSARRRPPQPGEAHGRPGGGTEGDIGRRLAELETYRRDSTVRMNPHPYSSVVASRRKPA